MHHSPHWFTHGLSVESCLCKMTNNIHHWFTQISACIVRRIIFASRHITRLCNIVCIVCKSVYAFRISSSRSRFCYNLLLTVIIVRLHKGDLTQLIGSFHTWWVRWDNDSFCICICCICWLDLVDNSVLLFRRNKPFPRVYISIFYLSSSKMFICIFAIKMGFRSLKENMIWNWYLCNFEY